MTILSKSRNDFSRKAVAWDRAALRSEDINREFGLSIEGTARGRRMRSLQLGKIARTAHTAGREEQISPARC